MDIIGVGQPDPTCAEFMHWASSSTIKTGDRQDKNLKI